MHDGVFIPLRLMTESELVYECQIWNHWLVYSVYVPWKVRKLWLVHKFKICIWNFNQHNITPFLELLPHTTNKECSSSGTSTTVTFQIMITRYSSLWREFPKEAQGQTLHFERCNKWSVGEREIEAARIEKQSSCECNHSLNKIRFYWKEPGTEDFTVNLL